MNRTFTLSELLSMSDADFSDALDEACSLEMELLQEESASNPFESGLKNIRCFAAAYHTIRTNSVDVVEVILN